MKKTFVLSVGGSLLVTKGGINVDFLRRFTVFIKDQVKRGHRFYLVVGGGYTARVYIKAALETGPIKHSDRDLVGIRATRLNAELLKIVFGRLAYGEVITDPTKKRKIKEAVIFVGGYKPGWSTDYVAVLVAKHNKAKTVINLSNIDYAYDKDPKKFAAAKKLEAVAWPAFRKIVGSKWQPGLNLPFDPVASQAAQKEKLRVMILNGDNLSNLANCLSDKKFKGTVIS